MGSVLRGDFFEDYMDDRIDGYLQRSMDGGNFTGRMQQTLMI